VFRPRDYNAPPRKSGRGKDVDSRSTYVFNISDLPANQYANPRCMAVADRLHKPLYSLSAGELGHRSMDLEQTLSIILEVAAKWDAVLLIDECDVFLEKRSHDNLPRNAIVAIFLRLLEYYQGVLFMTTNRVEAMDPAFQSRIHLTIQYPNLEESARRQIWISFVKYSSQPNILEDHHFDELSQINLNGREIKNLVKTAQLLACHENDPLSIEHVKTVLHVIQAAQN
jgi:SpoVK/Ycf46/Vps4 family AAA+-type ATPase